MPDSRQVQKNAAPNQLAGNLEDAFWRLKVNDKQDGEDASQSIPYPDRPGEPNCLYYMRTGFCGYGSNCRFNHPTYVSQGQYNGELPERMGQPDCEYFLKTGTCKYGPSCKYHHPKDRRGAGPVTFNILGLPMRQEEKSCPYYLRTGSCKFGVACKFHHPQPASLGTVSRTAGSSAFDPTGSTMVTSSVIPYVGATPSWQFPRVPYMSGLHAHGHQSYMPVVLSSSQGVLPANGWSTYMGNMSPLSSPTFLGTNLVYSSGNLGDSVSTGQVNMLSTSISTLPDRPDQPECRYFMNNRTCKYGYDCKFHHPKEMIAQQSAANPLGLPSRPGQAVCSYYSMYGLCKYGPGCKFDHPFVTPLYNYGINLPMLGSSFVNYPGNVSAVPYTETSPQTISISSDWIQESNYASNKHQNADTKRSPEEPSSPPRTSSPASETLHDHSD